MTNSTVSSTAYQFRMRPPVGVSTTSIATAPSAADSVTKNPIVTIIEP